MLIQLARQSDDCLSILKKSRSSHKPSNEALFSLLEEMLRAAKRTFLIIDALDECHRDEWANLLSHLTQLVGTGLGLNLLVTSRPEPIIGYHITKLSPFSISLHDTKDHHGTISSYISTHLSPNIWARSDWGTDLTKKVEKTLLSKSNGM